MEEIRLIYVITYYEASEKKNLTFGTKKIYSHNKHTITIFPMVIPWVTKIININDIICINIIQ